MLYRAVSIAIALVWMSGCTDGDDGAYAAQSRDDAVAATVAAPGNGMLRCKTVWAGSALPNDVRETSGLVRSARDTALFWTHNDRGHEPYLYAIRDGRLSGQVRVAGARSIDWEDIETARCGSNWCLYIGDIGDNDESREYVTSYRVVEPDPGASSATAEPLHARYPEGPRDAEALFAHGQDNLYIVNKGRSHDIVLYRWPLRAGGTPVLLEPVRVLGTTPRAAADRVTAASASPDGRWVAIRTYRTLYVYRAAALLGDGAVQPLRFDLSALREPQGEGLVLADNGAVWLSSEAESRGQVPEWAHLQCALPE